MDVLKIDEYRHAGGLRYWFYRGQTDRMVVCFAGIGSNLKEPQEYEFAKIATARGRDSALFIADTDRSWLNNPGMLDDIKSQIEQKAAENDIRIIMTLGHSMGGYCALIATGLVAVDCCVAYAPQFSVNPDIIPNEYRWKALRDRIAEHRIRSIEDYLSDSTRYFVLHGGGDREAFQREPFKSTSRLTHILLPDVGHGVPVAIRRKGQLEAVTHACFDADMDALRLALSSFAPIIRTGVDPINK